MVSSTTNQTTKAFKKNLYKIKGSRALQNFPHIFRTKFRKIDQGPHINEQLLVFDVTELGAESLHSSSLRTWRNMWTFQKVLFAP